MIKLLEKIDLSGCTAIIPTLSVANIPQLTVDLIIQNIPHKKIALIWHDAFIPYIGPDPFDEKSSDPCTTVEVFFLEDRKIIVLQIRSPTVGYVKTIAFLDELCKWLKSEKVKSVVILSSLYSHLRYDDEIQDRSEYADFRYVPVSPEFSSSFENSGYPSCGPFLSQVRKQNCTENDKFGIKKLGSGFATELYNKCCSIGIPSTIVLKFGSDGYNVLDAEIFLRLLNCWMKIIPESATIRYPYSWENLLCNNPPAELYMG